MINRKKMPITRNSFDTTKIRECKSCRWLNSADTGAADGNTCRRHSPITEAGRQAHRMWPYVYESDWCGDWERHD